MMKFVPAVAHLLCLALSGSFLTMFCTPFCAPLYCCNFGHTLNADVIYDCPPWSEWGRVEGEWSSATGERAAIKKLISNGRSGGGSCPCGWLARSRRRNWSCNNSVDGWPEIRQHRHKTKRQNELYRVAHLLPERNMLTPNMKLQVTFSCKFIL